MISEDMDEQINPTPFIGLPSSESDRKEMTRPSDGRGAC